MKHIYMPRGLVALVDDEDFEEISKGCWSVAEHGYAMRTVKDPNRKRGLLTLTMHREIMGMKVGDPREVDHIDGNKLNNQRSNLRVCTRAENQHNRGAYRTNTSGYKGVSFSKYARRWRAQIRLNGKAIHLGYFDSPEAAYVAYCNAAWEMHGEFAHHSLDAEAV